MRFFPTADIGFYVDVPSGWNNYCRYPKSKSWKGIKYEGLHYINYWRDLEGARMTEIKRKDLYFENWLRSRINEWACLPIFYCVGNRFIKITQGPPAGFKCVPMPMNLAEVREIKRQEKEAMKEYKKWLKEQKALAKKAKKKRR